MDRRAAVFALKADFAFLRQAGWCFLEPSRSGAAVGIGHRAGEVGEIEGHSLKRTLRDEP